MYENDAFCREEQIFSNASKSTLEKFTNGDVDTISRNEFEGFSLS